MATAFNPTTRQANWLIAVGLISVGYAIYLRYNIMENVQVGLGCDAGHQNWVCFSRKLADRLDNNGAFGWIALVAGVVAFLRPGVVFLSIALAATALGLVLHNAGLAGIAGGLIVLSFARPATRPEWR
ncbi:MAG TPA: hypothetical protein VM867_09940 [Xanthobacteraceae bacterium]|nr:hypothetical protein [Xanthobacteraceae bacterium]